MKTTPAPIEVSNIAMLEVPGNNLRTLQSVVRDKPLTALCMDVDFPSVGNLTIYEWLRFIIFHTRRHTIHLNNTIDALKNMHENN